MSESLDGLRTTELAGRLRLLGLRKDIEPGLMHAAADRLDRLDVLLFKAGRVEREIRKALGDPAPDWVDDASPEEIARRFDALPKVEVVTDPPATWSQQDKWERRCIDLGFAVVQLLKAAQPWREHVAAVLDDGHGLVSHTRTLSEALDVFDAETARIDRLAAESAANRTAGIYCECACNPGQYYLIARDRWICGRCGVEQDTASTAAVFALKDGDR